MTKLMESCISSTAKVFNSSSSGYSVSVCEEMYIFETDFFWLIKIIIKCFHLMSNNSFFNKLRIIEPSKMD